MVVESKDQLQGSRTLPLSSWSRGLCYLHILCFLSLWFFPRQLPWTFLVIQLFQSLALRYFKRQRSPADLITIMRGHMIALAASYALMSENLSLIVWLILILGFLLDGLDGFLARKLGQESAEGALFDMETDGVWVSVLCSTLIALNLLPAWGILLAVWRPFYVLISPLLPIAKQKSKGNFFAKCIFVFVSLVLILLASPWSQQLPSQLLAGIACGLLSLSFGKSIVDHWK